MARISLHRRTFSMLLVGVALAIAAPSCSVARAADAPVESASELPPLEDFKTWRITWDNDAVFASDNQFSNGWSFQLHGPVARSWESARGTPAFGKRIAKWFLPTDRTDLYFREGWALGQSLQTPDDTDRTDLIVDDVPYAAALAVQNTWTAFDDRRFSGFGWLLGIAGPTAQGEAVQKAFHSLIGSDEPQGWDNQLEDELLLNLYYERQWKFVRGEHGDIAGGVGGQLGNLNTAAVATVSGRLGWHVPRGFVYVPDPIGLSLSHDAQLPPSRPASWTLYGSLTARAGAVARALFYDGNTFEDSHSIDHETFVGSLIVGLHYQRLHWGVHLNLWTTTDLVDPEVATAEPDTTADFGTIMVEFRY